MCTCSVKILLFLLKTSRSDIKLFMKVLDLKFLQEINTFSLKALLFISYINIKLLLLIKTV